jgi:hypothetical protein
VALFHNAVPEGHRAWVMHVDWIDFDDVLLVDDLGDAIHEPPHVLVTRDREHGFFSRVRAFIEPQHVRGPGPLVPPPGRELRPLEELRREQLFPDPLPDVELGARSMTVEPRRAQGGFA